MEYYSWMNEAGDPDQLLYEEVARTRRLEQW